MEMPAARARPSAGAGLEAPDIDTILPETTTEEEQIINEYSL